MIKQQLLNYKALLWTIGVHIALLLLFFFLRYAEPAQAAVVPEMGMEVNLGTSDNGLGTDQPMDMEEPAAAINEHRAAAAAPENNDRDVETSDEPDAPEVAPVRPAPTRTPVRPVQTPPQPRPSGRVAERPVTRTPPAPAQPRQGKYVMPAGTGRGGNGAASNAPGGNEGNTFGAGDRGVPHGTPGAGNYTGSPGTGTGGVSADLENRNIIAFPPREAEFRQGGKVVVRVVVNREGTIISKSILSSTNAELSPIALRKVQSVKFNRSETAPAEQFGKITFVFKTRS